jgi:hypothetical protein
MTRRAVQPALPLVVPTLPPVVRAELRAQVEQDWGDKAVCASEWVDPDWWFAAADDPDHAAARTICGSCPVRRSCLAHAIATNEPEGIWGGFDEMERTWLRFALVEGISVAAILDPHTRTAAA